MLGVGGGLTLFDVSEFAQTPGGEATAAAKREAECAEVGELVASLLDCAFFFDARNFEVS